MGPSVKEFVGSSLWLFVFVFYFPFSLVFLVCARLVSICRGSFRCSLIGWICTYLYRCHCQQKQEEKGVDIDQIWSGFNSTLKFTTTDALYHGWSYRNFSVGLLQDWKGPTGNVSYISVPRLNLLFVSICVWAACWLCGFKIAFFGLLHCAGSGLLCV